MSGHRRVPARCHRPVRARALAPSLAIALSVALLPAAPVADASTDARAPAPAEPHARTDATPHATTPAALEVGERERLLIVAPHPDDESIGAAGLAQRVLARGGTVDVVLVTAGDGYPDGVRGALGGAAPAPADFVSYGTRRIAEARAALATLDPAASRNPARVRATFLGFPDGALATLRAEHWSSAWPARSRTTGASDPPYDDAAREPGAPYAGETLRAALAALIAEVRPTTIALPDPRDVHPDHATAGLFTLDALDDVRRAARAAAAHEPSPRLLAYLVHWPDWPPGWAATAIDPDAVLRPLALPHDLPPSGAEVVLELGDAEVAVKQAALACHATQQAQMPVYLAAFVRRTEPFTVLSR